MSLITLYRPDGEVIEYSDFRELVNDEPGYLAFKSKKSPTDEKGKQIMTTLPYIVEIDIEM